MKRDELRKTLGDIWGCDTQDGDHVCVSCGEDFEPTSGDGWLAHCKPDCKLSAIIAWLERLPAGCELVGMAPRTPVIYDTEQARGNGRTVAAWFVNPDDLTNAGKSRQFEAYECKKCNLDGPDNCWNHKVGKR